MCTNVSEVENQKQNVWPETLCASQQWFRYIWQKRTGMHTTIICYGMAIDTIPKILNETKWFSFQKLLYKILQIQQNRRESEWRTKKLRTNILLCAVYSSENGNGIYTYIIRFDSYYLNSGNIKDDQLHLEQYANEYNKM